MTDPATINGYTFTAGDVLRGPLADFWAEEECFRCCGFGDVEDDNYGGDRECVGSSRVDLQACKLEYSIVSPK